jgi:hypothetical protein
MQGHLLGTTVRDGAVKLPHYTEQLDAPVVRDNILVTRTCIRVYLCVMPWHEIRAYMSQIHPIGMPP